jgi:transposase
MEDLSAHYARLLGLGDGWEVTDVDLDLVSQRVTIRLERVPGSPCCCAVCGEQRPLKDHATEREWRHLDTMQFETVLLARTPRTNCPKCGVLNVDVPWAEPHGRFTLMFQAFAIRVLQASASIEQGRKLLGLSWRSAQDIMSMAVQRGLEVRDTDNIAYVGIDEKSFGKGHDYVSVLVDLEGRRVLEVAQGRTQEAADTLWKTLSDEEKDEVQAVAMDMWPAFLASAIEHVPQAQIVHDRFHISKHLGEAVDQVRRGRAQGFETGRRRAFDRQPLLVAHE